MKKTILKYIFLTIFSVFALTDASAQSEVNRSKSRLNVGKKSTSVTSPTLTKIPRSLDRSINLRPSSAINAYYRSILLSPGAAANASAVNKNRTNGELATASDTRPNLEEVAKSEDLFFVSEKLRVLNAYPNPANDYAEIDYQISGNVGDAKISLYNILGANVAEYDLDRNERQLRISTREIPTGVYFYQLLLEGKKVATKKLLIRH
ncbi:T9SS type A sorting domain-containing protein [Runella sp. CRIBMP]|uniref:T9SS type A sorting domain-containing protein n=1 Tax=Runella sp. CRIBMP TaxID=2683261 RepID=UPI00141351E1|nr:T9SS type A sorting domain-containing protein [Runella sp. CRIBMP]NBB19093.1 T9SS type A sorting domain-containing protein [Runella sp. CRIBMP]